MFTFHSVHYMTAGCCFLEKVYARSAAAGELFIKISGTIPHVSCVCCRANFLLPDKSLPVSIAQFIDITRYCAFVCIRHRVRYLRDSCLEESPEVSDTQELITSTRFIVIWAMRGTRNMWAKSCLVIISSIHLTQISCGYGVTRLLLLLRYSLR